MPEYRQKKIAVINDLSGYGRCSLTVALPVLSAMGVQCCPVPTSILSNHTGFPVYFFDDYTDKMQPYLDKWKELGLSFDGIITGFLGSQRQIQIVMDMLRTFLSEDTRVIDDQIMGDGGTPYATCTPQLCSRMRELAAMGDIITPNVTEACILTGQPYRTDWKREELSALAGQLRSLGPACVIITGIEEGGCLTNLVSVRGREDTYITCRRSGENRPGTGDVFTAVVSGACILGRQPEEAVRLAADFVKRAIACSEKLEVPRENGVCFELLLGELVRACCPSPEDWEKGKGGRYAMEESCS